MGSIWQSWNDISRPVSGISWDEVQVYIQWLNKKTGQEFSLPSETQWDYAARSGSESEYSWGDKISCDYISYSDKYDYCAGFFKPSVIKSYPANEFGLYDMHGNVSEWVSDCWNDDYNDAPENESARKGECRLKVIRGGSWKSEKKYLRSAGRQKKSGPENDLGFRLIKSINYKDKHRIL